MSEHTYDLPSLEVRASHVATIPEPHCLTRVPMVIKPPQEAEVRPGRCDALVELVDFSATVFELAGIDPAWSNQMLDLFATEVLPGIR